MGISEVLSLLGGVALFLFGTRQRQNSRLAGPLDSELAAEQIRRLFSHKTV